MTLPKKKKLNSSLTSGRKDLRSELVNRNKNKGKGGSGDGKGDGKGNGGGKGKSGNTAKSLGNNMPRYFGGKGSYKGVDTKEVKRLVNGMIRDETGDLRREKAVVRRDTRHEMQQSRRDYRRGKGDLKHIFGESGDYINFLEQGNQAAVQGAQGQNAAATAALQGQLGGTYTGAQDQINAEMERLGISGGANTSGLMADGANAQAMAGQIGSNAQQTLGLQGANASQLMNLIGGMNQGSYMSAMGQNLNDHNDQMTTVRRDRQDNFNEVRNAIRDVRGGRRDMFLQLLSQLQETGWAQHMDNQQLKLARKNSR